MKKHVTTDVKLAVVSSNCNFLFLRELRWSLWPVKKSTLSTSAVTSGVCSALVILLSARAGEESRVEGLEAGADDYLIKPFSARELIAKIGAQLGMASIRCQSLQREYELRTEAEAQTVQIKAILDNMSEPLTIYDPHGQILLANRAAQETWKICGFEQYPENSLALDKTGISFTIDGRDITPDEKPAGRLESAIAITHADMGNIQILDVKSEKLKIMSWKPESQGSSLKPPLTQEQLQPALQQLCSEQVQLPPQVWVATIMIM